MTQDKGAREFELLDQREGDIVVIAKKDAVIGGRREEHDFSNLGDSRLRSHGGLSEQDVPLLMSRPIQRSEESQTRQWRNFDMFDLLLNH
jgi:phosphonoacetate hydrolase